MTKTNSSASQPILPSIPPSVQGHFQRLAEMIRGRSGSVTSNEPLIWNLWNLNVAHILRCTSHSQRMQRIWALSVSALCGISTNIIFSITSRLEMQGLKWALETLLPISPDNTLKSYGPRDVIIKYGLRVSLSGYSIYFPRRPWLAECVADTRGLLDFEKLILRVSWYYLFKLVLLSKLLARTILGDDYGPHLRCFEKNLRDFILRNEDFPNA